MPALKNLFFWAAERPIRAVAAGVMRREKQLWKGAFFRTFASLPIWPARKDSTKFEGVKSVLDAF